MCSSRMTPLRTSLRPASNCGLTSAMTSAPGRSTGGTTGRIRRKEMNDTSIQTISTGPGEIRQRQVASVEVLNHHHARIVSQRPVELPVPDVERNHSCRAPLEEYVGESASRCADVERIAAGHDDPECVERVGQLQAAASDVWMVGSDQRDVRARPSTLCARLRHHAVRRRSPAPRESCARARSREGARPRSTTS